MKHAIQIYLFSAATALLVCLVANPAWAFLVGFCVSLLAGSGLYFANLRYRTRYEGELAEQIKKLTESNQKLQKRVESMETRTGFGSGRTPFPVP